MSELVITRGLPASGKTTYAREWVEADRERRARVNRDDIRQMLDEGVFVKGVTEQRVMAARNSIVEGLLRRGISVIVDDTNLPNRTCRDLHDIAKRCKAEFRIQDVSDVSLETCIARNTVRKDKAPVPRYVLEEMHEKFIKGKGHPLPYTPTSAISAQPLALYEPDESLPKAFICDIDGTVALKGDRDPFDESRVHEDRPNLPVIEQVQINIHAGLIPLWVSGRTMGCYAETWNWLWKHVIPETMSGIHGRLWMREVGDNRKDSIVKRMLFDLYVRNEYNVRFVLDDRNQVVNMWGSELGLTCLQVAPGDF